MNIIERLLGSKKSLNPKKRQDMKGNISYCEECKTEWENAQPFNRWSVTFSSKKETPLEREYPYTIPSTRPKIDNNPDQDIMNNPNNYFPISKFKIRL